MGMGDTYLHFVLYTIILEKKSVHPKLREHYSDKYLTIHAHCENIKFFCFWYFYLNTLHNKQGIGKFMNHEWGVRCWIEFMHKCSGDHWGPWASCSCYNFVKASLAFHLQLISFCKSNCVPDSICMAQMITEFVWDKVKPSQNIWIFFVSPLTFNISLQTILSSRESMHLTV